MKSIICLHFLLSLFFPSRDRKFFYLLRMNSLIFLYTLIKINLFHSLYTILVYVFVYTRKNCKITKRRRERKREERIKKSIMTLCVWPTPMTPSQCSFSILYHHHSFFLSLLKLLVWNSTIWSMMFRVRVDQLDLLTLSLSPLFTLSFLYESREKQGESFNSSFLLSPFSFILCSKF